MNDEQGIKAGVSAPLKILFFAIVILAGAFLIGYACLLAVTDVDAAKPTPYPEPGVDVLPMGNPYPEPATPTPGPDAPTMGLADCPTLPLTHPCAWGIFWDGAHWRAWMAYPGLDFGLTDGFVSIYGAGGAVRVMSLRVHGYNGVNGHTWYKTDPLVGCGRWYVGNGYIGGEWADIRLNGDYYFYCTHLSLFNG